MVLGAAGGGIHQLFDLFLNGVILGAIYVLLALGLNVILGLIGVINFAHAAFYMLGAYLTLSFAPHIGFLPAVAAAAVVVGVLGMAMEVSVIRPLYRQDDWPTLARALAQAQTGRGDTLLLMSDDYTERQSNGTYGNLLSANTAVNCIDRPWSPSATTPAIRGWSPTSSRAPPPPSTSPRCGGGSRSSCRARWCRPRSSRSTGCR